MILANLMAHFLHRAYERPHTSKLNVFPGGKKKSAACLAIRISTTAATKLKQQMASNNKHMKLKPASKITLYSHKNHIL